MEQGIEEVVEDKDEEKEEEEWGIERVCGAGGSAAGSRRERRCRW